MESQRNYLAHLTLQNFGIFLLEKITFDEQKQHCIQTTVCETNLQTEN